MIAFPTEWVQQSGVHVVTAYPPDRGSRFRWFERVRPCPTFGQIVDRILARDPWFRVADVGPMRRIVTSEGEYGAWVRIDGHRGGAATARFVGAVLTEEFASVLECVALKPEQSAELAVQSLAILRSITLGMARRPRHFYYVSPPGWQGVPSGPTTCWYAPDFPANLTTIVVAPSQPFTGSPDVAICELVEQLGAGLTESAREQRAFTAQSAAGIWARVRGRREGNPALLVRELAVVVVDNVRYSARLETTCVDRLDELHELFMRVGSSMQPLPTAAEMQIGEAFARPSDLFDHWAE